MICISEGVYLIKRAGCDQHTKNMQLGISDCEGTQQSITGNQNTSKNYVNKKLDFLLQQKKNFYKLKWIPKFSVTPI